MRAVYFAYVMVIVSLAFGTLNEFNELHVRDKGYPLIPAVGTGPNVPQYNEDNLNETIDTYGLNRVPSQAGDNAYLGTGGALLGTYNAFQGVFQVSTLGLNKFLENMFPSMPVTWLAGISTIVTFINLYAAISFIRGVGLRWL